MQIYCIPQAPHGKHLYTIIILAQYWAHVQSTSSNPWQSPHKQVAYNFVPQCLPNHTQPMGRCQKRLKGDWSIDKHWNCLIISLGMNFENKNLLWTMENFCCAPCSVLKSNPRRAPLSKPWKIKCIALLYAPKACVEICRPASRYHY